MSGQLIQQNQLVQFDARNPRRDFKRLRSGDIFLFEIEIVEETWGSLGTIPDNALLTIILKWSDGDEEAMGPIEEKPKKEKKPAREKGPHGKYWQAMFKGGFDNNLDIQEVLAVEKASDVKEALRAEFKVESLTFVSASEFERWLEHHALTSLITQSRQAQVNL